MTTARQEIVLTDRDYLYHCTNRCVRRGFLCGFDKLTGKDFNHRKVWVYNRMRSLASIFCINVAGYAIMCTHLHLMLKTQFVSLGALSNEDIARRWLMLYPRRRNKNGSPCEPKDTEILALTSDKKRIKVLRARLGSISWFMKSLSEDIARRANREDDCRGQNPDDLYFTGTVTGDRHKLRALFNAYFTQL